ncbi:rhodanese-like domain-containing protein [Microbacteriaceae bacterium]|nr:rhodanese-like domain-containing protein [Candidatus Saccharibacteria bacterium]
MKGAINIPPAELMAGTKKMKEIPKDANIVLYCLSGSRSNASMHYLRQMGYANLTNGINKEHVASKYGI